MSGDELTRCQEELQTLREENQHLREAANAFGALAERLNDQLETERRGPSGERRRELRDTPDRRKVHSKVARTTISDSE